LRKGNKVKKENSERMQTRCERETCKDRGIGRDREPGENRKVSVEGELAEN
jgi:hypothetical protein